MQGVMISTVLEALSASRETQKWPLAIVRERGEALRAPSPGNGLIPTQDLL